MITGMYIQFLRADNQDIQIPFSDIKYIDLNDDYVILHNEERIAVIWQQVLPPEFVSGNFQNTQLKFCEFPSKQARQSIQIILPDSRYLLDDSIKEYIQYQCVLNGEQTFTFEAIDTNRVADYIKLGDMFADCQCIRNIITTYTPLSLSSSNKYHNRYCRLTPPITEIVIEMQKDLTYAYITWCETTVQKLMLDCNYPLLKWLYDIEKHTASNKFFCDNALYIYALFCKCKNSIWTNSIFLFDVAIRQMDAKQITKFSEVYLQHVSEEEYIQCMQSINTWYSVHNTISAYFSRNRTLSDQDIPWKDGFMAVYITLCLAQYKQTHKQISYIWTSYDRQYFEWQYEQYRFVLPNLNYDVYSWQLLKNSNVFLEINLKETGLVGVFLDTTLITVLCVDDECDMTMHQSDDSFLGYDDYANTDMLPILETYREHLQEVLNS